MDPSCETVSCGIVGKGSSVESSVTGDESNEAYLRFVMKCRGSTGRASCWMEFLKAVSNLVFPELRSSFKSPIAC